MGGGNLSFYFTYKIDTSSPFAETAEDTHKPTLTPERVSLGVLRPSSTKQFSISSNTPDLLTSIKIARVKGLPKNVKVEMATEISLDNTRAVSVNVTEPAVSGMTEGIIELVTAEGQTHSIIIVGIVVATPSKNLSLY